MQQHKYKLQETHQEMR